MIVVPSATEVGVLDDKIAATGLVVGLAHRWYVVALCGQARLMTDLLQRIQDRLVGTLRAASVLLAGEDVIAVRVDDVPIARHSGKQTLNHSDPSEIQCSEMRDMSYSDLNWADDRRWRPVALLV